MGSEMCIRDRYRQLFSAGFISISRDFTPYFHFRCVAHATFDRNLIHSADACFLVMACVGYSLAKLKTLSSLLNDPRAFCVTREVGAIKKRLSVTTVTIGIMLNVLT